MNQQSFFPEVTNTQTIGGQIKKPTGKTRFTGKAKREALAAIMQQVKQGWDPPEAVWTLISWLGSETAESRKEKG